MQFVVCLRIFLSMLDLLHLFVLPLYVILVMVVRYSWYPHNVFHLFAMICSATTEMSPWFSSAPDIMSSPMPIVIILSQRWCLSITTLAFALTVLVHYSDFIMRAMDSQISSQTIVYSTVYSGTDQWKCQRSASPAFVGEFTGDRWIPRTWPVTRKMFLSDDVIMHILFLASSNFMYKKGGRWSQYSTRQLLAHFLGNPTNYWCQQQHYKCQLSLQIHCKYVLLW